jgi:hypothetical protein
MASTASVDVLDRHGGVHAASPLMYDSSNKSVCANQPYRRLCLPSPRIFLRPARKRIPRPAILPRFFTPPLVVASERDLSYVRSRLRQPSAEHRCACLASQLPVSSRIPYIDTA